MIAEIDQQRQEYLDFIEEGRDKIRKYDGDYDGFCKLSLDVMQGLEARRKRMVENGINTDVLYSSREFIDARLGLRGLINLKAMVLQSDRGNN